VIPEKELDLELLPEVGQELINAERDTLFIESTTFRTKVYQRVFDENNEEPDPIKHANAFSRFLKEKEIIVLENDLLAGHARHYNYHLSIPVFYPSLKDIKKGEFNPAELPPTKFDVDQEITQYLIDHSNDQDIKQKEKILQNFSDGIRMKLFKRWGSGHVIADFETIMANGFNKIVDDIQRLKVLVQDTDQKIFLESAWISCSAAMQYIMRYADQAEFVAGKSKNKKTLLKIANACRWIASNPPRTFFEAVQLLWLTHEILTLENFSGAAMSLGRMDQYLHPFYLKDLEKGILDYEQASVIIETLWLKFANLGKAYQNVTLGGCIDDGSNAANDLTLICLRASRKLKMDQPLLSLRCHSEMSDELWDEVLSLIKTGIGMPALHNDTVAIDAKTNMQIDPIDARNYGIVGCVELSIPGKEYANTEGLRFNWAKVMELVLNGGRCSCTGAVIELKNKRELSEFSSFADFYTWFKDEFTHYLNIGIEAINLLDSNYFKHWPNPFLSCLMSGCIENAKDITAGGTKYNFSCVNACGIANTADSLWAINHLVFDKKRLTLPSLAEAVQSNFEGHSKTRALLRKAEKFGNDNEAVDRIAVDLTDLFYSIPDQRKNPRGGKFQVGLYTVSDHAHMGVLTGALPDGRLKCTSLSNGLSPSQGMDIKGLTSVIKSVTRINHSHGSNGVVLDLKFHPNFFSSENHLKAIRSLIEVYFALGGLEMQFNVVDKETLINAQKNPESFTNLIVRVSGFSAYFVTLDKLLQDEIIARTEYCPMV